MALAEVPVSCAVMTETRIRCDPIIITYGNHVVNARDEALRITSLRELALGIDRYRSARSNVTSLSSPGPLQPTCPMARSI